MAIVGARPAQPWLLDWRSARHPRPRPRPQPARAAHRDRARRRTVARDIRPLLLAIAVAAGLAFFYLSQSTHVAATGYQIDALAATLAEQRATQQQLVSAIGHARSPAEITDRARRDLGLVPLEEAAVQFVRVAIEPPWSTIGN
jgi:cell division protein FtsB